MAIFFVTVLAGISKAISRFPIEWTYFLLDESHPTKAPPKGSLQQTVQEASKWVFLNDPPKVTIL